MTPAARSGSVPAMTPSRLLQLLHALELDVPDPLALDVLRTLEGIADKAPANARAREALQLAHAGATASQGLPPMVAGVLRDRLVRWDGHTSTWTGTDALTGARAQIRILRPWAQRDPLLRRAMERDGRALHPALKGLRVDPDTGALVVPMPGPEAQHAVPGGHAGVEALVGLVVRSLQGLLAWENAGLGLDGLAPEEICDAGDRLVVATLTPLPPGDAGAVLHVLAELVRSWWGDEMDHPLGDLLAGLSELPSRTVAEAAESCRQALADALAAERHQITKRERALRQRDERARLGRCLNRLARAVDPPRGRAAVGVDLDGRTLVVQNYDTVVLWGPVGERPGVVWSPQDGLDTQLARRLLRARGSAPVSERLNREVEGNPLYVDRITRWTSAMMELRTLRLLLGMSGDI